MGGWVPVAANGFRCSLGRPRVLRVAATGKDDDFGRMAWRLAQKARPGASQFEPALTTSRTRVPPTAQ